MFKKLNFSWVIFNVLAGSSIPTSKKDLEWLVKNQHIDTIVTLTEDKLTKSINHFADIKKELQFKYYHIPTIDGTGFFPFQYEKIIKLFNDTKNKKERMLIHCEGGYGRTSTALTAIWMDTYNKGLKDSIKDIKKENVRPQAIFTSIQLESLQKWEETLLKNRKKKSKLDFL